jgi:hypothetical protein
MNLKFSVSIIFCILVSFQVNAQALITAADTRTLSQIVPKQLRPSGVPAASAVCFSSRWPRPMNAQDPYNSFTAAADFHATGFYWVYATDTAWIKEVVRRGYTFQGSLCSILPDHVGGKRTLELGRIQDANGDFVTAPWMKSWKAWWGCVNSPEYRQTFLDHAMLYINAGVNLLQVDDPVFNDQAAAWGGCYCPYCKAKAAKAGKTVLEIQRSSVNEFYADIRATLDARAGRHITFSGNGDNPGFPLNQLDFGLAELQESGASAMNIHGLVRVMEAAGKAQLFTFVSEHSELTRSVIAMAYGAGSHVLVPWDVFQSGKPRYFGKAAEFADLYGFVRANAALFDGYELASFAMPGLRDTRFEIPPYQVLGSDALSTWLRVKPGDDQAPVVLHCVQGSNTPKPFRLTFDAARFFAGKSVSVELLTPAPYSADAHAAAEKSRNYAGLSLKREIARGPISTVEIPAFTNWALVVIRPIADDKKSVGQPVLLSEPVSLSQPVLRMRLSSATKGAAIRYTLDGSKPSSSSLLYAAPVLIKSNSRLTARAFAGGVASAPASVELRSTGRPAAKAPSDIPGLVLWASAIDLMETHKDGELIKTWPARVGSPFVSNPVMLKNQCEATPPVLTANAIQGRPALRFAKGTERICSAAFAQSNLVGAFTLFMVSRSEDGMFGVCGNDPTGDGGVPRLYITRNGFTYNLINNAVPLGVVSGGSAITTYQHDGVEQMRAWVNGVLTGEAHGKQYAAVNQFGAGGNLVVPYSPSRMSNQFPTGDLGEIIVFHRALDEQERASVEAWLAERWGTTPVDAWKIY